MPTGGRWSPPHSSGWAVSNDRRNRLDLKVTVSLFGLSGRRWANLCPSWWKHEEAISRLEASTLESLGIPPSGRLNRHERLVA